MATNIELDEKLVREAMKLGNKTTKKSVVEEALAEYVAHRKRMRIFELEGKIEYHDDYDYKELRRKR